MGKVLLFFVKPLAELLIDLWSYTKDIYEHRFEDKEENRNLKEGNEPKLQQASETDTEILSYKKITSLSHDSHSSISYDADHGIMLSDDGYKEDGIISSNKISRSISGAALSYKISEISELIDEMSNTITVQAGS